MPESLRKVERITLRRSQAPAWIRYSVAVVSQLVAALIRLPFEATLEGRSPYLTFTIAIILTAWYSGLRPTMLAIVLGGLLGDYMFVSPRNSLGFLEAGDFASLILFLVAGLSMGFISQAQIAAEERLKAVAAEVAKQADAMELEVKRRERLETRLRALVDELARSNRELQDFAFVASHDLQEPLRKIQAFGDRVLVRARDELSPDNREYVERMQNAANRMSALIEDLLAFSRVTSKAQPFKTVDLNKVVAGVLDDLQARIEQTHGKVLVDKLPIIQADRSQMRQLFQNLIANALKFNREGVPPVVKISSRELPEESYEIRVQDNGVGFDPKHADKIFTIFQRLHGRGRYEGSGIGLSICRKIAERHGGGISAESIPGEGSAFIVTLPADPEKWRMDDAY